MSAPLNGRREEIVKSEKRPLQDFLCSGLFFSAVKACLPDMVFPFFLSQAAAGPLIIGLRLGHGKTVLAIEMPG